MFRRLFDRFIWYIRSVWNAQRAKMHKQWLKRVLPMHIERILKDYGQLIPDTRNEAGNTISSHIRADIGDLKIKYEPLHHGITVWDQRFEIHLLAAYFHLENGEVLWRSLYVGDWCDEVVMTGESLYLADRLEKPKRQPVEDEPVHIDDLLMDEQGHDEKQL